MPREAVVLADIMDALESIQYEPNTVIEVTGEEAAALLKYIAALEDAP